MDCGCRLGAFHFSLFMTSLSRVVNIVSTQNIDAHFSLAVDSKLFTSSSINQFNVRLALL